MQGVEEFTSNNFGGQNSTFNSCLHLILHAYSELEKNTKYSRKDILNQTTVARKKEAKKIELEDYLRHDLVSKYIEPNRSLFGLDYYLFQSGAEEFLNNIKTGILDIKVCSPLYNGNTYYIFECKRLNKKIIDNYIKEGVARFISNQYYPESATNLAGMISFLESTEPKEKIESANSFKEIDVALKKHKDLLKIQTNLASQKLICAGYEYIEKYQYVFVSSHNRDNLRQPITIYHIVLDYNDLILD
ncbi:MAG: hypothetical protein K1X81_00520 [Bacteroidia bacterium]|nr:hypothetical protein [Bacteroidia bacterium]